MNETPTPLNGENFYRVARDGADLTEVCAPDMCAAVAKVAFYRNWSDMDGVTIDVWVPGKGCWQPAPEVEG